MTTFTDAAAPPVYFGEIPKCGDAAELVQQAWAGNAGLVLNYNPAFFDWCLSYPGRLPVIAPALYHRRCLTGLVIGMPRRVRLGSDERNLLLMTLFSVHPDFKGRGLGKAIWAECLSRARAAGYDGAMHYCVEGAISNQVTQEAARHAGVVCQRIFAVRYLMRLLKAPVSQQHQPSRFPADDFLRSATIAQERVSIGRIWTREEAEWHYCSRPGTVFANSGTGQEFGMLGGYSQQSAGQHATRTLFLEDILLPEVSSDQNGELVSKFIAKASTAADIAAVPLLGYADTSRLSAAGFRMSRRILNLYLTLWNGSVPSPVNGVYIDVL